MITAIDRLAIQLRDCTLYMRNCQQFGGNVIKILNYSGKVTRCSLRVS